MNDIVNKFLLTGLIKQPGFFTRNKQRIRKFILVRNTNYIYKNELNKASFEHDMAHGNFKNLKRRTQSDRI